MQVAVGHSHDVDTRDAIDAVISQCRDSLGSVTPKGALLFASTEYEHELAIARINETWPGLPLIGGSTDGELSAKGGFTHDSLVLVAFAGDEIEFEACFAPELSKDPEAAVAQACAGIGAKEPTVCFAIYAPSTNSSTVVRALERALPTGTPILGGLTGDHRLFTHMTEFCGDRVATDSLTLLMVYGDFNVSWGVGSGWFPIGDAHEVTASDGHVVHEIDGQAAIETYKRYWGDLPALSLGEYPIAVYPNGEDGPWCLRAALESHEDEGWVRFAGEVPAGARIRLTEVLPEGILTGTERSLRSAIESYAGTSPQIALAFSCAARKWVLGSKATEEVDVLTDLLASQGAPELAGCYCFGEIAPLDDDVSAGFHNESCVTVLLGQ